MHQISAVSFLPQLGHEARGPVRRFGRCRRLKLLVLLTGRHCRRPLGLELGLVGSLHRVGKLLGPQRVAAQGLEGGGLGRAQAKASG